MVAHNPLHRSGRAALPHPAHALGDNAKAHEGIGMGDANGRKPPVDVAGHPVPREMVLLTATAQGPPPQPSHRLAEGPEGCAVVGHPVVLGMPADDRPQVHALFRDGKVQAPSQFDLEVFQFGLPPYAHRLPQHRETTCPRLRAAMREAEEVEGFRLPVATPAPSPVRMAAEFDEAGFDLSNRTIRA